VIDQLREAAYKNQYYVLDYSVNQAGNIAATTTVLFQTKVPAGLLSRNGDSLAWRLTIAYAATASADKVVSVYFGPQGVYLAAPDPRPATLLFSTGALAPNNQNLVLSSTLVRYGINTSKFDLQINSSFAALQGLSTYGTNANNTQNELYLTVLGSGTNASDVNGFLWHVAYLPTSTPNG
jgi:hypothetical protein